MEVFDEQGLRAQNDKLISVNDMTSVLASLYNSIPEEERSLAQYPACLDLALNWLLNVYDA